MAVALHIVAVRLRQAREQLGLSQKKLGMLAGIDEFSASARMNQYERGKHLPDVYMVARLAKALSIPEPYFYCEDETLALIVLALKDVTESQQKSALDFIKALHTPLTIES